MIAEFNIENFYSIRTAQKFSFEPTSDTFMSEEYLYEVRDGVKLLKTGIIYGANASGKSNILRAFDFFKTLVLRMPRDRHEETGVVPFMLDGISRSQWTKMSMSFYIARQKYILSFELDARIIYSETLIVYSTARPTRLYKRTYNASSDSTTIEFGANLNLSKKSKDVISGNTINNCSVLAAFGKSNVERTKLNDVYNYFVNQYNNVLTPEMLLSSYIKSKLDGDKTGELKGFVLNFLKASDFNIEDVELQETETPITPELEQLLQRVPIEREAKDVMLRNGKISNIELAFKHKTDEGIYSLTEQYESNGTMRFLGMAVILNYLLRRDRFVAIDEVETSIHYELLSYFIKVFLANSNGTSQMLLTTHDINLLNEDFIRRDVIWFTEKDGRGETKLERLSSMGLHKNLSPYNAYRQGKLVRLPFLGSQYIDLNS